VSIKQKPINIVYKETKKINHDKFREDIKNLPLNEIERFPDTQKSKVRNKHNRLKNRETYLDWQNSKKICKKLTLKAEKEHFEIILSNGIMTNKDFWNKLKPALTEKNPTKSTNIMLKEEDELITDDIQISKILNEQYINVVDNLTGSAPTTLGDVDPENKESIVQYINKIITHFNEHPSI